MNSISTDRCCFELTPSGLLITTMEDTTQLDLSPGEALSLAAYLGGDRKRLTRREQRRLERGGVASYSLTWLEGFKTSTHQFEFLCGSLTIFDLQRDARLHFDPYHVIRLVDFIGAHRRKLMHMLQDSEVPEYFHFPDVPNYESETRHPR